MGRLRLGSVIWVGMILAGSCLGGFVVVAWPEPTTYLIRLPHGESSPKTPTVAPERRAPVKRVIAIARVVEAPQPQSAPVEENTQRELAGPPPVPAASEDDGYRPETAEQLGARPLPGMYPDAASTP